LTKQTYEKEFNKVSEMYNNEENDESMNKYLGTKNELSNLKEIPKVYEIEDSFNFLCAGSVMNKSVEGKFVLLADISLGILDLDNIIFDQNKMPIGFIDDVLGKIDNPFYIINFFPNYSGSGDLIGQKLTFVKQKAKFVNKQELLKLKGCDASNAFDEEVDMNEVEFSDDEEEIQRKERIKQKKNKTQRNNNYNKNKNTNRSNDYYSNNNNSVNQNNSQNCQEYKQNPYPNNNFPNQMYPSPYNNFNNFMPQQQQFFQNMTMFAPGSMFGPYAQNNNINMNTNLMNNQALLQHVNPFVFNNFNQK